MADDADSPAPPLRLRRNFLGAVAGRGLGIVSTLAANAVMGRLLPEHFGLLQTLLSLLLPISWMFSLGMTSAAVRLTAEQLAAERSPRPLIQSLLRLAAFGGAVGTAVLLVLFAIAGPALCARFNLPYDRTLLIAFAFAAALLAWQQTAAETLTGLHEIRISGFLSGGLMGGPVATLTFTLALVATAWWYADPNAAELYWFTLGRTISVPLYTPSLQEVFLLLLPAIGVSLVATFVLLSGVLHRRYPRGVSIPTEAPPTKKLLSIAWNLLLLQLAVYVTSQADVWVAADAFAQQQGELSRYVAARRLTMLAVIPLNLIGSLLSPMIATAYFAEDRMRLQSLLRLGAWGGGVPSLLVSAACLIAPATIVTAYLGPSYREATLSILLLAAAQIPVAWSGAAGYALSVTGHQRPALIVCLLTGAFVVVAGPWAARLYGSLGIAVVSALAWNLKYLTEWYLARRLLGASSHMRISDLPRLMAGTT